MLEEFLEESLYELLTNHFGDSLKAFLWNRNSFQRRISWGSSVEILGKIYLVVRELLGNFYWRNFSMDTLLWNLQVCIQNSSFFFFVFRILHRILHKIKKIHGFFSENCFLNGFINSLNIFIKAFFYRIRYFCQNLSKILAYASRKIFRKYFKLSWAQFNNMFSEFIQKLLPEFCWEASMNDVDSFRVKLLFQIL